MESTPRYVQRLLHELGEGSDVAPVPIPEPRSRRLLRDAADIAAEGMTACGASAAAIATVRAEIAELIG